MKTKTPAMLLRLPEDIKDLLDSAKAITGKSKQQLILDCIRQGLGDYPAIKVSILGKLDSLETRITTLESK
ncbi:MAG: hypothetical protein V7K26_03435 [Nostoc sp.]|uniref:hypothetical protein n=1 Tax=Nostoc sp. TaxID=1180 RepID=UPI002FF0F2CD